MKVFNAYDVLQFAIRVEENGEIFYREAARMIGDQGAKAIFARLAIEEIGHKKILEDMQGDLGDFRPAESYEGEYLAYLQGYIDGRVIFKGRVTGSGGDSKDMTIAGVLDTRSALDFAIQREVDSIVYYQEVKAFVPEKHHKVVDGIVDEERRHFALLSEIRKNYP
jgi:rubrerythrin